MKEKSRDINLEHQIDAYIKGQLSDEEAKQLWVELLKRPEYIAMLKTQVDLARLYQSNASAGGRYWKWITSAAAMVLLIVTIHILTVDTVRPVGVYTETTINMMHHMASAEVTRSSETDLDPADSLLNAGFKAAVSGNIEESAAIFQRVITEYSDASAVSKARLNLGILQYNSGNYNASIDNFRRAIAQGGDDSLLTEQSYWYLSNAYVNTDRLEEARNAVKKSYESGKIYKKESFRLLKRLDYELGNIDYDNYEQQTQESK